MNTLQMRKTDTQVWSAFLQWIRDEGARRGLMSTEAISRAAGIGTGTMSRWTQSKDGPSLGVLARVADALNISMADLGAAFDAARGHEAAAAAHRPWPTFAEFIEHVADVDSEEADVLRQTLVAIRTAKKSGHRTVIVS